MSQSDEYEYVYRVQYTEYVIWWEKVWYVVMSCDIIVMMS